MTFPRLPSNIFLLEEEEEENKKKYSSKTKKGLEGLNFFPCFFVRPWIKKKALTAYKKTGEGRDL